MRLILLALPLLLLILAAGCVQPAEDENAGSQNLGTIKVVDETAAPPGGEVAPAEGTAAEEEAAPAEDEAAVDEETAADGEEAAGDAGAEEAPKMITTPSGLKYEDLKVGDGPEAKAGDLVRVHYTGTLEDGTKFDSSVDRGVPFEFPLGAGRVIKGWDEGVAGMKVGGKRRLVIPAELGYGDRGAPPKIPPGATLIFDVELLEIVK